MHQVNVEKEDTMKEENDFCLVCEEPFTRTHPKQITCLKKSCQQAWKSGKDTTKTKIKKTYLCLKCGVLNTRGFICKDCSKANAKIQQWETWE